MFSVVHTKSYKKIKKGLDKCDEILYSNQRTDLKVNFKEIESKFLNQIKK